MKLFYWSDVLCDYTCGHVLIIAKNKDEALKMLKQEDNFAFNEVNGTSPTIETTTKRNETFIKVSHGGS